MVNFALGEWIGVAVAFVGAGVHALALGLAGAMILASGAMIVLALLVNHLVVRPLVGRPLISLVMVTLGLAALLRGASVLALRGVTGRVVLPLPPEAVDVGGILVAPEKIAAAAIAVVVIAVVTAIFRWSRTGLALRAIADDQQTALAMGMDLSRHLGLAWAMAGVIAVIAGTLWSAVAGGGLGIVLVGLKVFPAVVIGGLDSIPGTIIGAVVVGVVESLAAGYLDPWLGAGFSSIAPYVALIAMLCVRPYGLLGRADVARV